MSRDTQKLFFNPTCPSGGNFYACETGTNFVGCCARNPCTSVGCSAGNLKPASFDAAAWGTFPDQQCPTGSQWYTCASTDPPFMGCCKSNPCTNGCREANLTAAFLDSNPQVRAPFLSSSQTTTGSIPSSTSSSTAVASPTNTPATSSSKVNSGAIAGGVVGGIAFIAFLILVAVVLFFRRRKATPPVRVELGMLEEAEKAGRAGYQNLVPRPYDSDGIYEAPGGANVFSKHIHDPSHPISPYSTPTPAYSPGMYGNPQSPPGYPAVSELGSPAAPFLRHHESHQSFELPTLSGRANHTDSPSRSAAMSEGLGIELAAASQRPTR